MDLRKSMLQISYVHYMGNVVMNNKESCFTVSGCLV